VPRTLLPRSTQLLGYLQAVAALDIPCDASLPHLLARSYHGLHTANFKRPRPASAGDG
jgi:hypothetical protein